MEEPLPHQKVDETQQQITARLIAWNSGDTAALDDVIRAVYQELRRMADRYLRLESPATLCNPPRLFTKHICG